MALGSSFEEIYMESISPALGLEKTVTNRNTDIYLLLKIDTKNSLNLNDGLKKRPADSSRWPLYYLRGYNLVFFGLNHTGRRLWGSISIVA